MSKHVDGNFALIQVLRQWGITHFAGVNGGGIAHLTQYLEPATVLTSSNNLIPQFLSIGEYVAGFIPIGSYLASRRVAGCIVTTGAATKLASSGMSDCKLQNIPAIYLVALNPSFSTHLAPLQDVSVDGMNLIPQFKAEFGKSCIVIKNIQHLARQLKQARSILSQSRPVIILFYPDILAQKIDFDFYIPEKIIRPYVRKDITYFLENFPKYTDGKRIILYVCSEAARGKPIQALTTKFSELLKAATVWSVNGANAVSPDNPYGYGYITFGGNDEAIKLWQSMNENDILITLGFDPGEYALNLGVLPAGEVWHFTHYPHAYGHHKGTIKHRVTGQYHQIRGDIATVLSMIIPKLSNKKISNIAAKKLTTLNSRVISRRVKPDCVDFALFYETLHQLWQPNSIGFDDVCISYKDRQYITQRPHPFIQFYSLQDGSAMGNAFGLGIGAKLSNPDQHVFIFSGDGCWRLFSGTLADVASFDLRLFIINNQSYAIVKKGLEKILAHTDKKNYHSHLSQIDFLAAAKANGWVGIKIKPDLSNLKEVMDLCYTRRGQSILIEVPVDPDQELGANTRLDNLKFNH